MAEAGPSLPGISCAGEWLGWRMAEVMFCSLSTLALIPTREDAKTYFYTTIELQNLLTNNDKYIYVSNLDTDIKDKCMLVLRHTTLHC